MSFVRQVDNLSVLKKRVFHGWGEEAFQVNLRSSSFQVRVTDTGRFRALTRFFRDLWKQRKCSRKKLENPYLTMMLPFHILIRISTNYTNYSISTNYTIFIIVFVDHEAPISFNIFVH